MTTVIILFILLLLGRELSDKHWEVGTLSVLKAIARLVGTRPTEQSQTPAVEDGGVEKGGGS